MNSRADSRAVWRVVLISLCMLTTTAVHARSLETLLTAAQFTLAQVPSCYTDDVLGEGVLICWRVEGEEIYIGVAAETTSAADYVGFGLSYTGGMYGADIVTYNPSAPHGYQLQDRFSDKLPFSKPYIDQKSDVELVGDMHGYEDGVASFLFKRPLKPCYQHAADDKEVSSGLNHVLWARGGTRSSTLSTWDITYHGLNKKSIGIDFLSSSQSRGQVVEIPVERTSTMSNFTDRSSTETVSVTMHDGSNNPFDLTVGNSIDDYVCIFQEVPVTRKRHVVKTEIIVNSHHVHHMILYHCTAPPSSLGPGRCSMGSDCLAMMSIWAVGEASTHVMQPHVGIPVGHTDGQEYFKLEIHYNVPNDLRPAAGVDASGFKLFLDDPREFDAGIGLIGWLPSREFKIPAGVPYSEFHAMTSPACLQDISDEGIHIIGVGLHMHRFGRGGRLLHVRDGVELPPISDEAFFDFNHHRMKDVSTEVYRSDKLIAYCRFDTTTATKEVVGGEGTDDEMCMVFFMYYPRTPNPLLCLTVSHRSFGDIVASESTQAIVTHDELTNFDRYQKPLPPHC